MTIQYSSFGEYSNISQRDCPVPAADQPGNIFAPVSTGATNAWCDCMYCSSDTACDPDLVARCKSYSPLGYPWTIGGKAARGLPQSLAGWKNAARDIFSNEPPPTQAGPPVGTKQPTKTPGSTTLAASLSGMALPALVAVGAYLLLRR